jgi:hypothetical protein
MKTEIKDDSHLDFLRKYCRQKGDKKMEERLDENYQKFLNEVQSLQGKRLSSQEKGKLLKKARAVIYNK